MNAKSDRHPIMISTLRLICSGRKRCATAAPGTTRVQDSVRRVLLVGVGLLFTPPVFSAEEIIITLMLNKDVGVSVSKSPDPALISAVEATAGHTVQWIGRTRTHGHVFRWPAGHGYAEARQAATALSSLHGVLWAEASSSGAETEPAPSRLAATAANARTLPVADKATIDQLTVKLSKSGLKQGSTIPADILSQLSATAGVELKPKLQLADEGWVLSLPSKISAQQAAAMERRLEGLSIVLYADVLKTKHAKGLLVPNDPRFPELWYMRDAASFAGTANVQQAWDLSTGSSAVNIAVLDSGILFRPTHPDLAANLVYLNDNKTLIAGWDMISAVWQARDGNRRDNMPRDQGDWVSDANWQAHPGDCEMGPSSWHGSHVAGTIAASTNNGQGISGVSWRASMIPVRVLGACYGEDADIIDGIYWAVGGVPVRGTKPNSHPAHIINLSLGGEGACSDSYQAAIDFALSRNAVVVVAAGNEAMNVAHSSPANCKGVIAVSAIDPKGALASYSNFGTRITLAAPGGDSDFAEDGGLLSTINRSAQKPTSKGMTYGFDQGTSMATPVVSGVISLMLDADKQQQLTPATIKQLLQDSARPFPANSNCNAEFKGLCGAGILDAFAAVKAVKDLP
mgnify:FL=1